MRMFRFAQISPRKINLEIYEVYPDGGPYCIRWIPTTKKMVPTLRRDAENLGLYECRDTEVA